jgi:hypothetical protein
MVVLSVYITAGPECPEEDTWSERTTDGIATISSPEKLNLSN